MTVEKVQGISRLEQLCEEFSEEERVRELKQEKKRQKRKNRRKNKCVCDTPASLHTADEKAVSREKVCAVLASGGSKTVDWGTLFFLNIKSCNLYGFSSKIMGKPCLMCGFIV
jgi:hypothetical protein